MTTLTAVGVTPPWFLGQNFGTAYCTLSPGANLQYIIEVTPDDIRVQGYDPTLGNWIVHDRPDVSSAVPYSFSKRVVLTGHCAAVRARIVSYTSGVLNFQVIEPALTRNL